MPPLIKNLVDRFGANRTLLAALVGVGAVALIWSFSRWATAPVWVPLFPGMPLEMVGEITAQLDEAKVPYRLERGGAEVHVAERDLARTRVLLAQAGLPSKGRPGFELFDQPSWGMTDFTQRINYRRALEGELERTISQMQGIEGAQVHLALHETTVFRRVERPAEASVFLRLRTGARPGAELVEGITFLVASSVDGLTSENVTVLDNTGRVLSAALEPGLAASGLSKRQLGLQREVESYLEARAEELVAQVVGGGNVRVRVSATLNFDQVDRTVQSVDPDQQAITHEERSEIVPGPTTPGASSTVSNTTFETTRRVETFSGGIGNIKRMTVAVLVNDRVVGEGEAARPEPRGAEELNRVETLVRNAVGLDASRGDDISVVSIPFDGVVELPEGGGGFATTLRTVTETYQRPAIGLIGVILAFILGLQLLRTLRRPELPEPVPALAGAGARLLEAAEEEEPRLPAEVARPQVAEPEPGERERVSAIVVERPDNAARVLRAWLKDG